jgi:hypothetical protein
MKFCKIYVLNIDIDRIPFQCGEKFPENEKRKKHEMESDKEKPKVLTPFEINCICSSLGQSEFFIFLEFGGK